MKSEELINEQIPLLIVKQLVGSATEEELRQVDEWRRQNPYNEQTYLRLIDRELLTMEHHRRGLTDYSRPLSEMKHRLGIDRQGSSRRWYLAAAVIALLIIGGALLLWNQRHVGQVEQMMVRSVIVPGHTQAILTLTNGEKVELTADTDMERLAADYKSVQASERMQVDSQSAHEAFNNLSTPRGGEFKVTLEDGTEVWLNAETTLCYPEAFSSQERRVEVSGEAYFKVAHDTERPFYVVSGGQEVRVYGTEFNVNGYADETDIRTTLVEGSISLRPLSGNGSELMLSPGNQAVFDKGEARARVQQVDTEVVTSWRSGTFVFENQTMEQIMHTLSRWYDFQYEFISPDLAKTVFMGSIPRYGSFAEVAQIFEKMGGIRLRQKSDKVIISEK